MMVPRAPSACKLREENSKAAMIKGSSCSGYQVRAGEECLNALPPLSRLRRTLWLARERLQASAKDHVLLNDHMVSREQLVDNALPTNIVEQRPQVDELILARLPKKGKLEDEL